MLRPDCFADKKGLKSQIGIDNRERGCPDGRDGCYREKAVALGQFFAFIGVEIILVTPISQVDDLHFAETEEGRARDDFGVGVKRGAEEQETFEKGSVARFVDSAFALDGAEGSGKRCGICLEIVAAHEEIMKGESRIPTHVISADILDERRIAFGDVLQAVAQGVMVKGVRFVEIAGIDLGGFVMHVESVGIPKRFSALGKAAEPVMGEHRGKGFGAQVGQCGPRVIRVGRAEDLFRAFINNRRGFDGPDRVAGAGKEKETSGKQK